MHKLTTLGRVVEDQIFEGTIANGSSVKRSLKERTLGGSAVTLLRGARALSSLRELSVIVELICGRNESEARTLFDEYSIHYNPHFINPNTEALISITEWVIDGQKKKRHSATLPGPSERFLQQLIEKSVLESEDVLVLCSEYVTDYWQSFAPYVDACRRNGARIWSLPNTRTKLDEHKDIYRERLAQQFSLSELVILAHSDLGEIFNPKADFKSNLDLFKTTFARYRGLVLITRGHEKPYVFDIAAGTYTTGDAPQDHINGIATVGSGDLFAGALCAQLLDSLDRGDQLDFLSLYRGIPKAHLVAQGRALRPSEGLRSLVTLGTARL